MNKNYMALEFDSIIEKLKEQASSEAAKETLAELKPYLNEDVCRQKMAETTSARHLLDSFGTPPISLMQSLSERIILAEAGVMLSAEQLNGIALFATSCQRMKAYLQRAEVEGESVASYGRSFVSLSALASHINQCVNNDRLYDDATPELKSILRKKDHVEGQIKDKLAQVLKSSRTFLADEYITNRNGHYVLPIARKHQNQFAGTVIEVSGKGATVFMEPHAISRLQEELAMLLIEEDAEIRRILYSLSAEVAEQAEDLRSNMQLMEALDVLFAKAKLSQIMNARAVNIGSERRLNIREGRHPLLKAEDCVPLNFSMPQNSKGVIITGPNTGGKTVSLKTVGLLSLMAQCGLHIPCGEGSYIAMQDGYWCDIGDSQNISQNLSTFSGHISNVIEILQQMSCDSLVLLDELGSGTDPSEGMGIAIAVLEELRLRGCMFLVTTHYPEVKDYALAAENIATARMAFDKESLRPLYQLEMGKSGESCALHIARRLGLAEHLLERAHYQVYANHEQKQPPLPKTMPVVKSRLQRHEAVKQTVDISAKFRMGDNVNILPDMGTGIVFQPPDENGDVIVQVKDEKLVFKHTRLQLHIPAEQLYPPDYDFSIIFDTVANRKARHQMGKHHNAGLQIEIPAAQKEKA